jgi:sulfate transport system ATP-binding protein
VTSVFVTHDQEEAFEVADRVVIMNHGRIEQTGSPGEIFDRPANPFVMDFLGNVNVLHGSVQNGRARLGELEVAYPAYPHGESRAATAFVRSHELEIVRKRNGRPSLEACVTHVNPARPVVKVRVYAEAFGVVLTVDVGWERYAELRLAVGDRVWVSPRQVRVFVEDYAI